MGLSVMGLIWRHLPEALLVGLAVLVSWRWLWRPEPGEPWTRWRMGLGSISTLMLMTTFLLLSSRISMMVPAPLSQWVRAAGLVWGVMIGWAALVRKASRWFRKPA